MTREIETWWDLMLAIEAMTDEQQSMPIQAVNCTHDSGEVQEMMPGIAIATVEEFEFEACRSTHNNKYCPKDIVLLLDQNSFAKDGAVACRVHGLGAEWEGEPEYGKDGPTKPEEQRRPS